MRPTATLRSLADASGLSIATVSKILHGGYKGTTAKGRARVEAVTGLARSSGYLVNGSARRLRDGRHRAVLVVAPADPDGHAGLSTLDYLTGIAGALAASGDSLVVRTRPREGADPIAIERRFDGALVLDRVDAPIERLLADAGVPVVHLNAAAARGGLAVRRDDAGAAAGLVAALAGLGYRRVLAVGARDGAIHASFAERAAGIEAAAARHALACAWIDRPWWHGGLAPAVAASGLRPDTAVVAVDAHTALALLRVLPAAQPLACVDDCHLFRELFPDLTRARFDRLALGATAADLLLARIAGRRVRPPPPLAAEIHVGATTPRRP